MTESTTMDHAINLANYLGIEEQFNNYTQEVQENGYKNVNPIKLVYYAARDVVASSIPEARDILVTEDGGNVAYYMSEDTISRILNQNIDDKSNLMQWFMSEILESDTYES